MPIQYPIAQEEGGYRNLSIEMHGVEHLGLGVQVPGDISAVIEMNKPHQVDMSILAALKPFEDAVFAAVAHLRPDIMLQRVSTVTPLQSNLTDSLHAARYHQRQFLCRFRDVDDFHRRVSARGRGNLRLMMHDVPLRCELEAFLMRVMSSLDAVCQLLGKIVLGKPMTFTEFRNALAKQKSADAALRAALGETFSTQAGWIDEARKYRNKVAHESHLSPYESHSFGADGVASAALAKEDAADFVLRIWTNLRQLMLRIAETMNAFRHAWSVPIQ